MREYLSSKDSLPILARRFPEHPVLKGCAQTIASIPLLGGGFFAIMYGALTSALGFNPSEDLRDMGLIVEGAVIGVAGAAAVISGGVLAYRANRNLDRASGKYDADLGILYRTGLISECPIFIDHPTQRELKHAKIVHPVDSIDDVASSHQEGRLSFFNGVVLNDIRVKEHPGFVYTPAGILEGLPQNSIQQISCTNYDVTVYGLQHLRTTSVVAGSTREVNIEAHLETMDVLEVSRLKSLAQDPGLCMLAEYTNCGWQILKFDPAVTNI